MTQLDATIFFPTLGNVSVSPDEAGTTEQALALAKTKFAALQLRTETVEAVHVESQARSVPAEPVIETVPEPTPVVAETAVEPLNESVPQPEVSALDNPTNAVQL